MREPFSFHAPTALVVVAAAAVLCGAPGAIEARQGQDLGSGGGQITEGPTKLAKPPTLATLGRFAGTWSCSIGPVAASSFKVTGMLSPQGAFVLQTPTTVTHFTSPAGSLQFTRSSTAGGTVNYALSSYAPHGVDLVFQDTNRDSQGGSAPANTFTPTFEIKRDGKILEVIARSPKSGTLDYSCTRV